MSLYYTIEAKGHFGDEWKQYPTNLETGYPASSSDYTVLAFGFSSENETYKYDAVLDVVPSGGQVDFQMQAIIGYYTTVPNYIAGHSIPVGTKQVFTGETSKWSNSQTISIPDGSVSISTSPNQTNTPTPSPTVPEFPTLIILPLFALATLLSIVLVRKIPKNNSSFRS